MAFAEVAEGVYRLGTKWANFYLVVEGGDAVLIDAGYPGYVRHLDALLTAIDRPVNAVAAVIVTHHHVDHAGTAEYVRSRGARAFVHEADAAKVRGEQRSHVPPGFYRQSWRPSMARYLVHTVAAGGARNRRVADIELLRGDQRLDLPGRPLVFHTPGHTAGHCSVLLPDHGVLFTGDAMVNFDYAAGVEGLALHRFNEDRPQARLALDRFQSLDADLVLFGHGDPWRQGLQSAIRVVRGRVEAEN